MELLKEAKGGNREAFDKLLEEYRHIFYKTARIYFREDYSATAVLEKTIHDLYRNLVDCRNEYEFKLYGIELVLKHSAKQLEVNESTKLDKFKQKSLTAGLSDESRIVSSIADDERDSYELYRKSSVVESYIASLPAEIQLSALLYYYADIEIKDIAKLQNMSAKEIKEQIDISRTKIYEMIKSKEAEL